MAWELLISAQASVQINSTLVIIWSAFIGRAYGIEDSSHPLQLFAAYEYHCTELTPNTLQSRKDFTEEKNGSSLAFQSHCNFYTISRLK